MPKTLPLTIFAPQKVAEKVRKLRQKVACVANFHQQITFIPCNDVVSVSEP